MTNLLFITGKLNITDGVSSHLYNLINELSYDKNLGMMILCSGGNAVERFRKPGIIVKEESAFDHDLRSLNNFTAAIKKLIRIIKENKISIVHSHNHYAANIAFCASKFTGIKTIQTIHGLIPDIGFLRHFKAQYYITVNEPSREYMIKNNIGTKRNVFYINQGVPLMENPEHKSQDESQIICASRLIYEKGIDLFIKAVNIVRKNFSGKVKFIIAGSGEYEDKLKALDKELSTGIEFHGEVVNLPELFSRTNIFVMPTRSVSEGFPMTIAEASLSRNLIITSNFNSFGNLFRDNIDGYIFKVGDFHGLAEKILEALDHPERTVQMADTYFRRSKILFDSKKMSEKHLQVYESAKQNR